MLLENIHRRIRRDGSPNARPSQAFTYHALLPYSTRSYVNPFSIVLMPGHTSVFITHVMSRLPLLSGFAIQSASNERDHKGRNGATKKESEDDQTNGVQ